MDQHYVTQGYLSGFCDPLTPAGQEPWVWVCRVRESMIQRRAPKNAAVKADYYSVQRGDGSVDDRPEKLLSLVESNGLPVISKLRHGRFQLSPEEREHLALFLGFLITRTPGFRGFLERAAGKVGESMIRVMVRHPDYFQRIVREVVGEEISDEEIEDARVRGLDPVRHFIVRGTPEFSLGQALALALTPARLILDMRWEFVITPGPEYFVTGDVPVTWRNPNIRPPLGAGLALRSTEVSFPISPQIGLLGTWTGGEGVRDVTDDVVRDLNRERVRHADRFVFSCSEEGARAAQGMYDALRGAGEAHAVPFAPFVIEEGEARNISAEIAQDHASAG
jgi:hypothetical protein